MLRSSDTESAMNYTRNGNNILPKRLQDFLRYDFDEPEADRSYIPGRGK
jgi:hypothetical protein